jgi:transposase
MSEPTCPGCRERDAIIAALLQRVAQLEEQVRDLQARLGRNASNSSLPPSANPPAAPKPVTKKPSGRQAGGQPGHQGHTRTRLPPERLAHVIPLIPSHCAQCHTPLPPQASPHDPTPTWHQFAELPRVAAVVTEFQGHARTCPACAHVTHEAIPVALTRHAFGPRLSAALSYLNGSQYVSKRGQGEVAETLFGVPLSLGSVVALQGEVSATLAGPHQEALQAVRAADIKNVDETSWKQAGQKRWLWVAVTTGVLAFLIHRRRGADGLQALLGEQPDSATKSMRGKNG